MSNIATKLSEISAVKSALKGALTAKGIDMTDVPFNNYPEKINEITAGVDESILLDIKQSIINKGVDMTNTSYDEYASKIDSIPLITPNTSAVIKGNTGSSATITIGSKVVCISGASSMWEMYTLTLKATIDGSSVTLTNDNGTLVQDYGYGSGAGRRAKQLMWINNKTYKDSIFTNATISGTDGDSTSCISAIKY